MNFYINGVQVFPIETSTGVYEVLYSNRNRLPRKLKKELKKKSMVQVSIINNWIKQ